MLSEMKTKRITSLIKTIAARAKNELMDQEIVRLGASTYGVDMINLSSHQVETLTKAFARHSEVWDAYSSTQAGEYIVIEFAPRFFAAMEGKI